MAKKAEEKELDMSVIYNQKIVDVDLDSEMKKAYIDYAMSVIVSRALPDVRDGLKPVHRRILYDMYEANLLYENDFKKSAATVGDVLAKYHPHGDASVYDAMVRLGQDFSLRYPLVQPKGNFGSIDGDPPAAYRYTEAKMSKIAAEMLSDIEKETVDFVPNYDDKLREPDVLPSRFPQLLVNGSSGIAVGMATNIPPHNMSEVIDGIIAVIDDPLITTEELMGYIQGPDFPTGGVIMGKSGIRSAYTTGRGKIIMRAKTEVEEMANGRYRIHVTELPYQVNKLKLERHINELVRDGKIDGISATRDESDEDIHLFIELKKDANPGIVLNNLFKLTQLQDTFGIILLALVDKTPKILTLREMINYYIAHQEDVIRRRVEFDLRKAKDRAHILEGYKIVIDYMDEVIQIIRRSKGIPESKAALMERFGIDDIQATAIVQMQLGRLSGMEREKIENEYNDLVVRIAELEGILAEEGKQLEIVKNDLLEMKRKYGDERRTYIEPVYDDIDDESLIEEENVIITMTDRGYVKRLPVDTYRSQNRGGRGVTGVTTREEDFVEHILATSSHDLLLFFTNKGVVYSLKAYRIPEASRQAKGTPIINLLPLETDEKISAMISVRSFDEGWYLTFITKNGTVKKTSLMAYSRIRAGGLRAIELEEGDELMNVKFTNDDIDLIIVTKNGMSIRFNVKDVRPTGRATRGVRGIRLRGGDSVVGASIILPDTKLLTVTENGYGKKTDLDEYRVQSRGGTGILTYKITDKTGKLAAVKTVTDDDDIMLVTSEGVIIRLHSDEISTYSRHTQGVRLMRLDDGVNVVSLAKTDRYEEEPSEKADGNEVTDD